MEDNIDVEIIDITEDEGLILQKARNATLPKSECEILECELCLNITFEIPRFCPVGHVVCKKCFEKERACPPCQIMTRRNLQDLAKEVDPTEQLDEDVEDMLINYAENFMEDLIEGACTLTKHRKSTTIECKDVQAYLERKSNCWLAGFGNEELRPYKRAPTAEAHKQRMALIKKSLKKY